MAALKLATALVRARNDLAMLGVRHALVGGLAVSARAEPRTTRDIDFAVAVKTDAEAEQVVHALTHRGYAVQAVLEQQLTKRLATVRLVHHEHSRVLLDLLFASTGIEPEIVERAEPLLVMESTLPVATIPYLIAMKVLARDDRKRPQDWDDLRSMLHNVTFDMLQEARAALKLIEMRGTHRGRDLIALLDSAVQDFSDDHH